MAQFYTLKEAADRLGVTPEEMKRRLQSDWSHVKPMLGGQGPMFRSPVIDELARTLGRGSDPELQLGEAIARADTGRRPSSADDIIIDADLSLTLDDDAPVYREAPRSAAVPGPAFKGDDTPRTGEQDIIGFADESSTPKAGSPADSDVKLERDSGKGKPMSSSGTDEIELNLDEDALSVPPAASPSVPPRTQAIPKLPAQPPGSGKLRAPKPPIVADAGSSEFELKLDDDDEEIDFGKSPKSGRLSTDSGINLQRPADSGINLERASDDEIDFELNLDQASSQVISSKSAKNLAQEANSEFELTLDDEGDLSLDDPTSGLMSSDEKKDIFETDFEIPAIDDESASEAVALEEADTDLESSDFDLEVGGEDESFDESGSAVVAIEEDLGDEPLDEVEYGDDLEEGDSASAAMRGVRGGVLADDDDEEEYASAGAGLAPPAPWGVVPALFLLPCVLVMGLTGIMGFELIRGMWGYHQPHKPIATVTSMIAQPFMDETDHKKVFSGD